MRKAIVLLSGGIDSQTCLAIAKQKGYECYALAIDYGQKHVIELERAKQIAAAAGVAEFRRMSASLGDMSKVALLDPNQPIPYHTDLNTIKPTMVPGRNSILLSMALAWAEFLKAQAIFFGANLMDYHGFPDTRPEFLLAFEKMAQLATLGNSDTSIVLEVPLLYLTKGEIIKLGLSLGIDYSLSVTCYQASSQSLACGYCDSCAIRKQAFAELGIEDPIYLSSKK